MAVPDEEEIERLSLEKAKGLLRAKDMECDRRLREMQNESRSKDKEISELKEQIECIFVVRMSPDEYEQLIKALEQADDRLKSIIKNARILNL